MERVNEVVIAFLLNATWQTTVVAFVGFAIARGARAQARFAVLCWTLVIAALTPFAFFAPVVTAVGHEPISSTFVTPSGTNVISTLYLIGLMLALVRLCVRVGRALLLRADSTSSELGFQVSRSISSPITIGRTIIVPLALINSNDAALLTAAIAHESAHVRRLDYALNVVLELLSLPLYFHPAAYLLRRSISDAREIACDEIAAGQCGAHAYVTALVTIAARATSRPSFAMSMAATSIERRVESLLRHKSPPRHRNVALAAVVVTVIAAACTRWSATPSQQTLGGHWKLVPSASDFHNMQPDRFDEYSQRIVHGAARVTVQQHRVSRGAVRDDAWSVVTDGVQRPIPGIPAASGRATWRNGVLTLAMAGPGRHRETVTATIRGNRLICDGATERGRFHAEFARQR